MRTIFSLTKNINQHDTISKVQPKAKSIMKNTLTLLALTAALGANAQCYDYDCSDATAVNIEDGLSNYDGSVCFSGTGTIPTSVNWNNWSVLSFDGEITVNQNINFGSVGTKLISKGNNNFAYWSMDGADTAYVKSGICEVETIVSNNSFEGSRNVVVVDEGAEFYFNGIKIDAGATILTAGGTGNNVKVIAGCSDIPLPIEPEFSAETHLCMNYILRWDSSQVKEILVDRKDTAGWITKPCPNTGYLQGQLDHPTYFRLKMDGKYTPIKYVVPCYNTVDVYPNPTNDFLTINGQINRYYVSDLSGRVLLSGNENKLSLQSLASGLYILTVNNQQFKIVKQ